MRKVWRIVGFLVLGLIVAGILAAGIGMLTGASLDRMVENIFGGYEALEMVLNVLFDQLGLDMTGVIITR